MQLRTLLSPLGSPLRNRHRALGSFLLPVASFIALGGASPAQQTDVTVAVTNLRSTKGQVLACLTTQPKAFPDCAKDPQARKLTVPTREPMELHFGVVPHGRYAISLIHDENANGKLDTRLIIPREGYGFSRDAAVRMGPPKFDSAAFEVGAEPVRMTIRMRYLL